MFAGVVVLALGAMILWLRQPEVIASLDSVRKSSQLPAGNFVQTAEAYAAIGEPVLALQTAPPTLQLPDLRQQLIYYGKNGRPDAKSEHTFMHFSFTGQKNIVSTLPSERLYLIYDRKSTPPRYNFSPKNQETSLWIEANPQDNEALVRVCMCNDQGEIIAEPENHSHFKLPEKEFIRYAGMSWELGTWKVDGTLLARQRARWFGPDRFLERHGGDEYKEMAGKSRIDFGEGDEIYSVFVGINDCLIWDDNRWKVVQPGAASLGHPLLVVRKSDDRLMTFELWDVEGKGKVTLNLIKSSEPWMAHHAQTIQHLFKFVGARTRTQYVFEVNQERMVISPSDWLLLTQEGWKKLAKADEIDDYVKRKLSGVLFVFEGLARKEDKQVMLGTLYNTSRTDFQTIELPLQQAGGANRSTINMNPQDTQDWEQEGEMRPLINQNFRTDMEPLQHGQTMPAQGVMMPPQGNGMPSSGNMNTPVYPMIKDQTMPFNH